MATLKYLDPGDGTYKPLTIATSGSALDKPTADSLYVPLAGGAMSGPLVVPAPTVDDQAANKGYVDQEVTVSTAAPTGAPARDGVLWVQVPA